MLTLSGHPVMTNISYCSNTSHVGKGLVMLTNSTNPNGFLCIKYLLPKIIDGKFYNNDQPGIFFLS